MVTIRSHRSPFAMAQKVGIAVATAALALSGLAVAGAAPVRAVLDPVPGYLYGFAGSGVHAAPVAGPAIDSPLELPAGVAVDSLGNVYIADAYGVRVEKVDPSGTLSVFAGTGTQDFPTPGPAASTAIGEPVGVAVDASNNVYLADQANHLIEKITPSGTLSIFAGTGTDGLPTPGPATSSNLSAPFGLAFDSSNNLFVADEVGQVIEKITPSGTLSIFAGTGTQGTPTPGPATSSSFDQPIGLAVDSTDNVYVSDLGNLVIEKITPSGTLSIFAGNGSSGEPTAGLATASSFGEVTGLAVDPSDNIYVADYSFGLVEKITPSGTMSTIAGNGTLGLPALGGPATSSPLDFPIGLAVDSHGGVLIADAYAGRVDRIGQAAPAPILVRATATKRSTVLVSWRPPASGTGKIVAYAAVARDASGAIVSACFGIRSNRHCTIGGLTSGHSYAVGVFAVENMATGARGHVTVTSTESAFVDVLAR